MSKQLAEISWNRKYRPQALEHILLPKRIMSRFADGNIGAHLLFAGTSGLGKTTLARILSKNRSVLFLEAGIYTGINDIRDKVIPFASTGSLVNHNAMKVVIIDEASELSIPAQKSLKSVTEKYEKNVFFIMTANHPENLIDALKSRFEYIDFNFSNDEAKEQIRNYQERCEKILQIEGGWSIEPKALAAIFKKCYPDMREILNVLYQITRTKKERERIAEADLTNIVIGNDTELYEFLTSAYDPEKIYKFVKSKYYGREIQTLANLGSPFLAWLNQREKHDAVLGVAMIVQKYGHEAKTGSIDLMITLLAACSAISKLFNKR